MKTLLATTLLALSLNADMCDIYLKQTYKNLKLSDKAHDFGFKTEQKTYASLAELNAKQVMLHCSDSVDQKYASDVIEVTSLILEK